MEIPPLIEKNKKKKKANRKILISGNFSVFPIEFLYIYEKNKF